MAKLIAGGGEDAGVGFRTAEYVAMGGNGHEGMIVHLGRSSTFSQNA